MTIMTDPDQIKNFRLLTLLTGLKLEAKGFRKAGRSCYQIVKAEFNLTGNRKQVLDKYQKIIDDMGIKDGAKA